MCCIRTLVFSLHTEFCLPIKRIFRLRDYYIFITYMCGRISLKTIFYTMYANSIYHKSKSFCCWWLFYFPLPTTTTLRRAYISYLFESGIAAFIETPKAQRNRTDFSKKRASAHFSCNVKIYINLIHSYLLIVRSVHMTNRVP